MRPTAEEPKDGVVIFSCNDMTLSLQLALGTTKERVSEFLDAVYDSGHAAGLKDSLTINDTHLQFDLRAALSGAPLVTADGRYAVDFQHRDDPHPAYPYVAQVVGEDSPTAYTPYGKSHGHQNDLYIARYPLSSPRDLEAENERLFKLIETAHSILSNVEVASGVCMCGDDMTKHAPPLHAGHTPVDSGSYHAEQLFSKLSEVLAERNSEKP